MDNHKVDPRSAASGGSDPEDAAGPRPGAAVLHGFVERRTRHRSFWGPNGNDVTGCARRDGRAMLSISGIFGMAAYSVSRRLKELGIRMALGAQRREVLQAALGRALKLLAFGSAAGLLLGILASGVLAFIVYQATPRDPLVLAGVVLIMTLLGLLATWIPAQRALSLDPMTLLREE